jgi:hypothetical protein
MIPASVSLQDLRLPPSTRVLDLSVMRAKGVGFDRATNGG